SRELAGNLLAEGPPLRAQKQGPAAETWVLSLNRFHRFEDGARHQDHSSPTAVGGVIDLAVLVVRKIPQVVQSDIDQSLLPSPLQDAFGQYPFEHSGKESHHVKSHRFPADPEVDLFR